MEIVIKVKNLKKSYNNVSVIKNLNISINKGEIFGLLGENGTGKSTTIECILGIKKVDSGDISILNMNPIKERKKLFQYVGVQFQESNYQDKITVEELCEETKSLYKISSDYHEILDKLEILNKIKSPVNELSGGEKQRLFVVLSLIPNPKIVFLDEITTGLDTKARRKIWEYLLYLKKKGTTIFLTSHFMDEAEVLCDRIGILKDGEFIFYGTVCEAIKTSCSENLESAYLWYTREEKNYNENI